VGSGKEAEHVAAEIELRKSVASADIAPRRSLISTFAVEPAMVTSFSSLILGSLRRVANLPIP